MKEDPTVSTASNVCGISRSVETQIRAMVFPRLDELKKSSCAPEICQLGQQLLPVTGLSEFGAIVHEISDDPQSNREQLLGIRRYPMMEFLSGALFRADIVVCNLDGLTRDAITKTLRAIRRSISPGIGDVYLHASIKANDMVSIQDIADLLKQHHLILKAELLVPEPSWLAVFNFKE